MIPVLAVGFALLGGLLLWFVIDSRGAWWMKLPAIVVTCVFTFAVWHALGSFSGWPTTQDPPARALLLASAIDEPRAIYVWLQPETDPGPLGYRPRQNEPRAYRLPYSPQLHAEIDRATKLAKHGSLAELRRTTVSARSGSGRRSRFVVRGYHLPGSEVPRKDEPPSAQAQIALRQGS
jgi:hypothetical protein